jgi:Flp pilus assembly protein TadG
MGLFDLSYGLYSASVLQGAIQKAARDATIESSQPTALDARVKTAVHNIVPTASLTFTRSSYANFSDIGVPEDFTDVNGDGRCDAGEPFEDENGNGTWDEDRGREGNGGARDAVLYTVTASYPRPFPVTGLLGLPTQNTITARTVLRNQPWDIQDHAIKTGNCS